MNNLFLMGILLPLLALVPVVYAQNMGSNYVNNEAFNQAKNTCWVLYTRLLLN